jgi:hypothetical protein
MGKNFSNGYTVIDSSPHFIPLKLLLNVIPRSMPRSFCLFFKCIAILHEILHLSFLLQSQSIKNFKIQLSYIGYVKSVTLEDDIVVLYVLIFTYYYCYCHHDHSLNKLLVRHN